MASLDADDIYELRLERKKQYERCQCDVEFGTCPGVVNCPYAETDDEDE